MTVQVFTLTAAHELLHRHWPGRDAPATVWAAHYRRAADLYSRVANVDPAHHHEALFWAADARESARKVTEKEGAHDDHR